MLPGDICIYISVYICIRTVHLLLCVKWFYQLKYSTKVQVPLPLVLQTSFIFFIFIFFWNFVFIFYRIKYIHLNTITFTQIIISWILNRLSDSHWRNGMENMLRQIGNLFYTLSHFYGFHLYYWVLSITFQFFFKN